MLDPTRPDPPTLLGRPSCRSTGRRRSASWPARARAGDRAGGSVGSRLAEALLDLGPSHLTLLDHHDHALFGLKRRLDDLIRERPTSAATPS